MSSIFQNVSDIKNFPEEILNMRAQVTLIPTESKKFIAKAVARMEIVQNALKNGIIALHPSTSTVFIVEELIGKIPETEYWVCGIVSKKGTCRSATLTQWRDKEDTEVHVSAPAGFPHTVLIEKGKLKMGVLLGEILNQMGPEDVYIKGVNAVDTDNTVGVLIGNRVESGTIGVVMARSKRKGFKVIFPVGLEKLIPIPVRQAAEEAALRNFLDYSMGMPCAMVACKGLAITETKAVEILTGATAVAMSMGGLGGAEGAITMIIKGDDDQVPKAIEYIEEAKGAEFPKEVRVVACKDCQNELCSLSGLDKHWCWE
jgi:hypothetical protein